MPVEMPPAAAAAPALKEIFSESLFRKVAADFRKIDSTFNPRKFLRRSLPGLEELTLLQRLRRMTEALQETLPRDYPAALERLRQWIPSVGGSLVALVPPDYVAMYGRKEVPVSLEALRFFTAFGSSEFGIRPFLKENPREILAVMHDWAKDPDPHIRRLASEGSRPLLPWSFRLTELQNHPDWVAPLLETLRSDASRYVRKSVANHLNDISRHHPEWVLDRVGQWPLNEEATRWIVRHGLRTLIRKGHASALSLIGATGVPEVQVVRFSLPPVINLPGTLEMDLQLVSTGKLHQHWVVDYRIHYLRLASAPFAKVFKWKEVTVLPGDPVGLRKRQRIQDFTTRKHLSGRHSVEILVNGSVVASGSFDLRTGPSGKAGAVSSVQKTDLS